MVLEKIKEAELFSRRINGGLSVVFNDGHFRGQRKRVSEDAGVGKCSSYL
jgi:hypothetical protein